MAAVGLTVNDTYGDPATSPYGPALHSYRFKSLNGAGELEATAPTRDAAYAIVSDNYAWRSDWAAPKAGEVIHAPGRWDYRSDERTAINRVLEAVFIAAAIYVVFWGLFRALRWVARGFIVGEVAN